MERFVAVLIEHTAGKFPIWLTPDQAIVLPISEKYQNYAEGVLKSLNNSDIRTLIDDRNEKIGKKIRDNELRRIPYLLIVGEKEESEGTISVRKQGHGDLGSMKPEEFIDLVAKEVDEALRRD
jgi:threonyl-tRNA synthetase